MAALAQDDDFPLLTDAVADAPLPAGIGASAAGIVSAAEIVPASPASVAAPTPVAPAANEARAAVAVPDAEWEQMPPAPATNASDAPVEPAASASAPPAPLWTPEPAIARLVHEQSEVAADEQGEPSIWAVPANDAAAIMLTGPDSQPPLAAARDGASASVRGDTLWDDASDDVMEESAEEVAAEIARTAGAGRGQSAASAAGIPGAAVDDFPLDATLDATRWNLMAEDIRMQVLQRIDIFTDTGLQAQLTQRLQPIVDRASADLVAAINQHVGQILRAYVAEAIEREIEKWRQEPR
jgi:hypothetical protein